MSVPASTAYLLVFHGSRDPRPGQAMEQLAQLVRSHLQQNMQSPQPNTSQRSAMASDTTASDATLSTAGQLTRLPSASSPPHPECLPTPETEAPPAPRDSQQYPLVGTACLEFGFLPLHEQLKHFSRRAQATGATAVRVVPMFLAQGVHVMEDLPTEVQQAQQSLPEMAIKLCPHVGGHPHLRQLFEAQLAATTADHIVLLAHGSRQPGGNSSVSNLARSWGGSPAFWTVAPNLESQISQAVRNGIQRLAIVPYFLFPGRITDAITQMTADLSTRFPQVAIRLLSPIGPSPILATLVTDLALDQISPSLSPPTQLTPPDTLPTVPGHPQA
jgi:sirohydrochlorin cobaltochelatase